MDLILQRLPGTLLLMTTGLGVAQLLGSMRGSVLTGLAGTGPDRALYAVVLMPY